MSEHERTLEEQIALGLVRVEGPLVRASFGGYEPPEQLPGPRYALTDAGNSLRFTEDHKDALIYVKGPGWYVWDGKRWLENSDAPYRAAKETARRIRHEAAAIQVPDDAERKVSERVFRHAMASESRVRIEAMVVLASKGEIEDVGLVTPVSSLDGHPNLLNCGNGTVDLKTGRLRPHRKQQYLTHLIDLDYDPGAKAPLWEKSLREIFEGDDDLTAYVQCAVGYSATGEPNPEKCFFIPYGRGDNGKSLFMEIVTHVLGDLAHVAAADTFVTSNLRPGNVQNDLASMRGARLVRVPETGDGERLARQVIKTITGGDTIKARFLYREHFAFLPQFKVWIATNHLPTVPHTDKAAWSRIKVIPFPREFRPNEQNKNLRVQLLKELPGILTWIVRGAREWYKHGLGDLPLAAAEATFDYRASQDTVGRFLVEVLVDDSQASVLKAELYREYADWCKTEGLHAIGRNTFHAAMREGGYLETKDSYGNRLIRGVRTT
jgi:putative DNA primase/helicase